MRLAVSFSLRLRVNTCLILLHHMESHLNCIANLNKQTHIKNYRSNLMCALAGFSIHSIVHMFECCFRFCFSLFSNLCTGLTLFHLLRIHIHIYIHIVELFCSNEFYCFSFSFLFLFHFGQTGIWQIAALKRYKNTNNSFEKITCTRNYLHTMSAYLHTSKRNNAQPHIVLYHEVHGIFFQLEDSHWVFFGLSVVVLFFN